MRHCHIWRSEHVGTGWRPLEKLATLMISSATSLSSSSRRDWQRSFGISETTRTARPSWTSSSLRSRRSYHVGQALLAGADTS